jgi:hypothetical protein
MNTCQHLHPVDVVGPAPGLGLLAKPLGVGVFGVDGEVPEHTKTLALSRVACWICTV